MTKEQVDFLIDTVGIDGEIYEGYSGRGTYGKETFGIIVKNPLDIISEVINWVHSQVEMDDENKMGEWYGGTIPEFFETLQWDNMGRDYIVY